MPGMNITRAVSYLEGFSDVERGQALLWVMEDGLGLLPAQLGP